MYWKTNYGLKLSIILIFLTIYGVEKSQRDHSTVQYIYIYIYMYLLAINQALPYGCSFVTYGHPEGSAAGDITIIWNDVFK